MIENAAKLGYTTGNDNCFRYRIEKFTSDSEPNQIAKILELKTKISYASLNLYVFVWILIIYKCECRMNFQIFLFIFIEIFFRLYF